MSWFGQLFSRRRRYDELSESIREHLDEKIEDLMDRGMTREQAQRTARREFGNATRIEERSREVWQWSAIESVWADIKYALRRLCKSPGFTITALLTLALGIGANTGIFTLLDAVLLKSLPVPHPEQLFLVKKNDQAAEKSRFSYPLFARLEQQLPSSSDIAAMSWTNSIYIANGSEPQNRVNGQLVSGNYFQVFETHPALGRLLTHDDDNELSGSPVAVLSYGYWQRSFASDPTVVGRKISINGVPFSIVGVAARGFFGAREGTEPDLWMPLTMQSDIRYAAHYSNSASADISKPWIPQENIQWLQFVVRVKDSSVVPETIAVMNQQYWEDLELQKQSEQSLQQRQDLQKHRLALEPGQQGFATLRREFEQPLFLLMGMAAMVLLIACANIANLLLARAAANERAVAVQLSMGANRGRLIRQVLTECLLLSTCGGILGIAVAFWCTHVLPKWASTGATAIPLNLTPDPRVLIFSVFLAMVTGVLFGLAPALYGTRVDPASVLRAGGRGISGSEVGGRWSLRKILVSSQVGLSLVLLVGAGMFLKTLANYGKLDPGFDRDHVLSAYVDTGLVGYQKNEFMPLYKQLTDRIDAIPGIRSSSVATCALAQGCLDASDVRIVGESGSKNPTVTVQENSVSLDYFKTVGVQLLQGRDFATTDNATAPKIAVVNQTFARRFLKGGNAVGRRFSYIDNNPDSFVIVGLVTDARVNDIREIAPPLIYFPIAQRAQDIHSIDVRTTADPQWVAKQVRQAITEVDHRLPIIEINTLSEQVDRNLAQQRLIARLTTMFGILALGLSCLGLYGVMSYTVQLRTNEIGIRLALGSPRSTVLWMILKETLLVISAGAVFGLVFSALSMHLAMGFLFGLSPEDPATIGIAGGLLFLVSIGAGLTPAWRAANISPTEALRFE